MKISTEIASCAKHVGEAKAIELFAKAGFDAWDFSMFAMASYEWGTRTTTIGDHPLNSSNYLAFARELKRTTGHQSVFIAYSDASLLAEHVSSQCFVLLLLAL